MERKLSDLVQEATTLKVVALFQCLPTTPLAAPLGTWPLCVRPTKPVVVLVLVLRSTQRSPLFSFLCRKHAQLSTRAQYDMRMEDYLHSGSSSWRSSTGVDTQSGTDNQIQHFCLFAIVTEKFNVFSRGPT